MGMALTPRYRRLLSFIVTDGDLEAVSAGKDPALSQSFTAQTAPADEHKVFSAEAFALVKQQFRAQFQDVTMIGGQRTHLQEILDQLEKQTGDPIRLTISGVVPIGIIDESAYSISATIVSNTQIKSRAGVVEGTNISVITIAGIHGRHFAARPT
jgi:hypothetical protein